MTDVLKAVIDGNQEEFLSLWSRQVIGLQDVDTPYSKDIDRAALLAALGAVVLSAGEAHVGQVGGQTVLSNAVPAAASFATPYASGDVIGGKLTFEAASRLTGLTGLVQMVTLFSRAAQTFPFELWLFHTDPTASTLTDNSPFSLAATDFDKVACVITGAATDWRAGGIASVASIGNLAAPYKTATGSSQLFGALVARGAATLASADALKLTVKALVD